MVLVSPVVAESLQPIALSGKSGNEGPVDSGALDDRSLFYNNQILQQTYTCILPVFIISAALLMRIMRSGRQNK